jgi:hypothetical protein
VDFKLFPPLPENLSDLSVEELNELLTKFKDVGTSILKKTADFSVFGDVSDEERAALVVTEFTDGTVAIKNIEAEIAGRTEGETNLDETLQALGAEAGLSAEDANEDDADGDSDGDGDADGDADADAEKLAAAETDEPEVEGENKVEKTVTADGQIRVEGTKRMALPATPRSHGPAVLEKAVAGFVASSGLEGFEAGKTLDARDIREAFVRLWSANTTLPPGSRDSVKVARLNYGDMFPDERVLTGDGPSDREKIMAAIGPEAMGYNPLTGEDTLIASGGICALPTPMYDVAGFGRAMRPVRDALPSFGTPRGGISVAGGITIADIDSTATGIVTAEEDETGGTTGAKSCWHIDCPEWSNTFIEAIYQCLEFGNFNARTWPELIDRMISETRAAHARLAETNLLDKIAAGSTAVTRDAWYGGFSTIIQGCLQAAAGMRSRHRTDPNLRLRALLPAWLPDLLLADLMHSEESRLDVSRESITGLLRKAAIEPTWYVDGATGAGQVFDAQTAGTLDEFPDTAVGYLFPEGTWLHLDGGTLDLGIVRDQELNLRNDYATFAEDFENVAFIGVESLALTFTVCPSGATAPKGTLETC